MSAKLQAKANRSPVYFYVNAYRGEHSASELYAGNSDNLGKYIHKLSSGNL